MRIYIFFNQNIFLSEGVSILFILNFFLSTLLFKNLGSVRICFGKKWLLMISTKILSSTTVL